MLTDAQVRKLEEMESQLTAAEGEGFCDASRFRIMKKAYLELAEIVKHIACARPDEHEFPAYAALINDINCTAFAMKMSQRMTLEKKIRLFAQRHEVAFEYTTQCAVQEALMVVRPWVRIAESSAPDIVERLSAVRITLAIDDEALLDRTSLRDHLIGPDGYGFREKPFSFKNMMASGTGFFRASELVHEQTGTPLMNGMGATQGLQVADPSKELGFMMPNGSKLTIDLHGLEEFSDYPATVVVGLVAAIYTTRSSNSLPRRKQDWSPRDP